MKSSSKVSGIKKKKELENSKFNFKIKIYIYDITESVTNLFIERSQNSQTTMLLFNRFDQNRDCNLNSTRREISLSWERMIDDLEQSTGDGTVIQ